MAAAIARKKELDIVKNHPQLFATQHQEGELDYATSCPDFVIVYNF
jgi:hypothetical protein